MKLHLLLTGIALLLTGCASLSEEECRAGDWRKIGYEDGTRGRSLDFISNHAEACAEYGVRPDVSVWTEGRAAGLQVYCSPRVAFTEGRNGRLLKDVCPSASVAELRDANRRGLTIHRIEQEISSLESDIGEIDRAIASLPADDPARAGLIADRARLRLDILELRGRRNLLL